MEAEIYIKSHAGTLAVVVVGWKPQTHMETNTHKHMQKYHMQERHTQRNQRERHTEQTDTK
jgi:exopolysaccharide biosynthesis protein